MKLSRCLLRTVVVIALLVAAVAIPTQAVAAVDLAIVKFPTPFFATVGTNVIYYYRVFNKGADDATNVQVTDSLPAALQFQDCQATDGGVCSNVGNDVTVDFPVLRAGLFVTIAVLAKLADGLPNGLNVYNTANVTADQPDFDPASNTVTIGLSAVNPPCIGGLYLTTEFISGDLLPAPGDSGVCVFRVRAVACKRVYGITVTGYVFKFLEFINKGGTVTVRPYAPSTVLITWSIPVMDPGDVAELCVVERCDVPKHCPTPAILVDGRPFQIAGPWWATYFANGRKLQAGPTPILNTRITVPGL